MRDDLLRQLEETYRALDEELARRGGPPGENPCGQCFACCTARGLTHHQVSDLELDYIAENVGPDGVDDFRRYAARTAPEELPLCPYFDRERFGCSIYAWRPFACRTFGHYRAARTRLPDGCVFEGTEDEFPRRDYLARVPLAARLRELVRQHSAYSIHRPARFEELDHAVEVTAEELVLSDDDPVDRALRLQLEGRLEEAFEQLQGAPDAPHVWQLRGLVLEQLRRFDEAVSIWQMAAERIPDQADFHYHVGYNWLEMGRRKEAAAAFMRTIELDPGHAMALGMTGYLHLFESRLEPAQEWFARASDADPTNGFFALRRGQILLALGHPEAARAALERAAECPGTAEKAAALLAAL